MLELLARDQASIQPILNILQQNKSQSADQFFKDYSCPGEVSMHQDNLISYALNLDASDIIIPEEPKTIIISDDTKKEMKSFVAEDQMQESVLEWLNNLSAKKLSPEECLAAEREKFISLCQTELTLKRMNKILHRS